MQYLSHRPAWPLSNAIGSLWLYSGYNPPHLFERILPSGTIELVISLSDGCLRCYESGNSARYQRAVGPIASGAKQTYDIVDTAQQREIMGAHIFPGAAPVILGIPASELRDIDAPLSDIWGSEALRLQEQLISASDASERFALFEASLRAKLRPELAPPPFIQAALRQLENPAEGTRLGDLAASMGLSSRRFIHAFTSQVGLSPKAYARIRRFQAALRQAHRRDSIDWADLAVECGYYDQAHLIRDFKAISGFTPGAYSRLKGEHLNHVPLPERSQILPAPA